MATAIAPTQTAKLDPETAALLIEAASVVGRPLDAILRYRLMTHARSVTIRAGE